MRLSALLLSSAFFLFIAFDSYAAETFSEKLGKAPCPTNETAWNKWINEISDWVTPSDPRSLPPGETSVAVLAALDRCEAAWEKTQSSEARDKIKACTKRLRRYVTRAGDFKENPFESLANRIQPHLPKMLKPLLKKRSHSLGFNVTDQEYYQLVDQYVGVPDELQNSNFLQNVSHPWKDDGLKKARAYLDGLNLIRAKTGKEEITHFYFETKLGNFENSQKNNAGRLFVRIPGNPVKYVQFATHVSGGSGQTSVVAVYTDKKGTLHTYIKDHFRDIHDDGKVTLRKVDEGIFKGNACINCHQSGPRAIDPNGWNDLDAATKKKIEGINKEFASMSAMEWGGFYDTASMDLGPALGGSDDTDEKRRSDSFFQACTAEDLGWAEKDTSRKEELASFQKNPSASYKRLREAMNCTTCHDGVQRGPIKLPFDRTHTFGKISKGEMPPGNKLSRLERSFLGSCLRAEFFGFYDPIQKKSVPGVMLDFLTGVTCDGKSAEQKTHIPSSGAH